MFERFTGPAREVVIQTQREARDLGHQQIGTEHVLLALLAGGGGAATVLRDAGLDASRVRADVQRLVGAPGRALDEEDAAALQTVGIDLDAVLTKIEETFGADALEPPAPEPRRGLLGWRRSGGHIRFSPRAKKVLELSLREAIRLSDNYIGTEHILLGLIREGEGLAAKIMHDAGVDLTRLRQAAVDARQRPA